MVDEKNKPLGENLGLDPPQGWHMPTNPGDVPFISSVSCIFLEIQVREE
jgi:hypothetical protein